MLCILTVLAASLLLNGAAYAGRASPATHRANGISIHPLTERRIGAARGRPTSFVGEVHRAIRRAGGNPNRDPGTGKGGGRFNARGRGAATALSLKDRNAWSRDGSGARTRARRVAVKARVVKLNPQRGACACRKSNPDILVVQPAENWTAKNLPSPFDGARERRILLQG